MREAIVLSEWDDMPVAEAAVTLQGTPGTIESRLYPVRNLLRERLTK
jgi:DNA-directed RNA polymerase specialized sigma24 family protein